MGNVKHAFTSAKADGGDASLVRPSNWNAAHTGAVEILDRDLTQIDVANEAAETSVYSFSIPANALGVDGGFRLTLSGDMLKNAAGAMEIRVKLGATTVFLSDSSAPTSSANRHKWTLVILCLNSVAAAQKWNASMKMVANVQNLSVQVIGSGFNATLMEGYSSSAEDTTGALTLEVTIDWSVADASLSFRKEMALLELIPAA
ncbi:hypothetical protein LCGC14_2814610 [marine sediment metagenome]|uniref:Uncharacterized protein n=1 Tax=marine sediment metagenome TaxID=412755 RepID=A0A0F8YIV7_9ZZZZ